MNDKEIYKILDLEDLPNEQWKDVEGYEGLYQISNFGRVKSLERTIKKTETETKHINTRIMKQRFNYWGYLRASLSKDGKQKTLFVHRLVAKAFLPNHNNLLEVNHIDEVKINNTVENLEWCSRKENINHGTRNSRVAKANSIAIVQIDPETKIGRKWESAHQAQREGGFKHGAINACCKNKFNKEGNNIYKGFEWSYFQPPAIINL